RRGARNQCEKRGPVVKEGDSQSSAIEEWPDRMNRRMARNKNRDDEDQIACGRDRGTDADFCEIVPLATPSCLAAPDPERHRHAQDAGNRRGRMATGPRDVAAG